jgi:hypothetical protein
MPRLVHRPPASFHPRTSNWARIRCYGKDRYLPSPFSSPESGKAYSELLARLVDPDVSAEPTKAEDSPAPRPLTIAELVESYWEHAKTYDRAMTCRPARPPSSGWRFVP